MSANSGIGTGDAADGRAAGGPEAGGGADRGAGGTGDGRGTDGTASGGGASGGRAAGGGASGGGADRGADGSGEDVQTRVRGRIRALRTERGLTLAAAAGSAGMDPSSWSRLESGARRLTLDHLPVLARALGVTVDALLEVPPTPDPRVQAAPRTRDGMTFWPLNRHPDGPGHHAFKIRLPSDRRTPMPREHEGHDWLYVLSGRLRLVLGDEEFVLGPGEAAEFSTRIPHWLGVVDEPVELLGLFGPDGERVHVHA